MPFIVIKGAFRIVGSQPDGDSIHFFADNPALIHDLPGPPDPQPRPYAQLRIEAIDALETHYAGARHQPLHWARAARDRLLDFVGIRNVQWDTHQLNVISAADNTRGWILAREREKNRRPVSFLFAGETPSADGSELVLKPALLRTSYNYAALAEGLAYPTYYDTLFSDLRDDLTQAVKAARAARKGLWPDDRTTAGFNATNMGVIIDQAPILPKLFRRLSDYMAASQGSAVGFKAKLAEVNGDPVWDLRQQNRTHLDTFVDQAPGSTHIRLQRDPEELVFDPAPQLPSNHFAAAIGAPISGEPAFVAA
jgi:endonuclease YncB( thermonuclease family)